MACSEMHKMDQNQLANPFVSATVVVADQFVDTFPHPQGLLAYLHRLCLQLDVDIVSLERPVTVKGSWKTIIKIDAFLKMLISSLHSAISKGAVPSEEDYKAAFSQFQEESCCRSELAENKHISQDILLASELNAIKTDGYIGIIKADDDKYDPSVMDKWYFNSNPRARGKTMEKRKRCTDLEKQPPEPYIIVEADDTSKINKANLTEIEHVLRQVYKKETIEKYQKRSAASGCDKHTQPAVFSFDFTKEEIVQIEVSLHNSEELSTNVERKPHTLMENTNSNSLTHVRNSISSKELKALEINLNCMEKEAVNDIPEQTNNDKGSRPVRLRVSRNRLDRNKTVGIIENDMAVLKRVKKHKRVGRKGNKFKKCCVDVKQVTDCKTSKDDDRVEEMLPVHSQSVSRCDKKANSENITHQVSKKSKPNSKSDLHKINKKAPNKQCKQVEVTENETKDNCISTDESQVEDKASLHLHHQEANVNVVKTNNVKMEVEDGQYDCDQCSYSALKHFQLLEHKRRVHLTRKFRCEECLKEFGFLKDLRRHMKCHTKAENCCDICGKMYKEVRKLTEHKRVHADGYVRPEFPCKFCLKIFSTKYVLAYHIKADHLGMKRSYICPTCGKSFSQKNSYHQHANVHLGIRPFTCEICGKRFSYDKSLKEHKFMHNDEKVFFCSICKKSFRQASGLAIHQKVHKTTKDYVCSMCGKGFNQKQALVRHERIHAGDKPYECALCKRTFADSSVLRRHMILIHKKDPKQWREDTKCYVPKRTDFFISVLNGDISSTDNSQFKFIEDSTEKTQCQLNRDISSADNSQMEINKDISKANNSRFNSSELFGNSNSVQKQRQSEFYQQRMLHDQFMQRQNLEESLETVGSLPITSGHYDSTVSNKFPVYDQRETEAEEPGDYTYSSSAEKKGYVEYDSAKIVASKEIINYIGVAEQHVRFQNQINSPDSLQMHGSVPDCPGPLPMHSSVPSSAHQVKLEDHQVRREAHQHCTPFSSHVPSPPNPGHDGISLFVPHSGSVMSSAFVPHSERVTDSATFVPLSEQVTTPSYVPHTGQMTTCSYMPPSRQLTSPSCVPGSYQQSQFICETGAVGTLPAQSSTMHPQSYAQTIVIFQNSLGTFHRPGFNFAISGDNTDQAANLQHVNPSLPITSAPVSQVSAVSQSVSSSSGQMYEQVLSPSHQLPQ